jgi:hypothetical protein
MCWSLNITQNSSRRTHDLKNWLTFSFEVHEGLSRAWNKGLSIYWPIRSFLRKPHTNGMITLRTTVLITICTNYVYRWWLGFSWKARFIQFQLLGNYWRCIPVDEEQKELCYARQGSKTIWDLKVGHKLSKLEWLVSLDCTSCSPNSPCKWNGKSRC